MNTDDRTEAQAAELGRQLWRGVFGPGQVCEQCGFVAKTPQGFSAHRRQRHPADEGGTA